MQVCADCATLMGFDGSSVICPAPEKNCDDQLVALERGRAQLEAGSAQVRELERANNELQKQMVGDRAGAQGEVAALRGELGRLRVCCCAVCLARLDRSEVCQLPEEATTQSIAERNDQLARISTTTR